MALLSPPTSRPFKSPWPLNINWRERRKRERERERNEKLKIIIIFHWKKEGALCLSPQSTDIYINIYLLFEKENNGHCCMCIFFVMVTQWHRWVCLFYPLYGFIMIVASSREMYTSLIWTLRGRNFPLMLSLSLSLFPSLYFFFFFFSFFFFFFFFLFQQ